jgi:hypothetical protein
MSRFDANDVRKRELAALPFLSLPLSLSLSLSLSSLCVVVAAVTHRTTSALLRAKGNPGKAVLTGGGGTMVTCHPGSWTGRLPVILLSACNKCLVSGGGNLGDL